MQGKSFKDVTRLLIDGLAKTIAQLGLGAEHPSTATGAAAANEEQTQIQLVICDFEAAIARHASFIPADQQKTIDELRAISGYLKAATHKAAR